MSASTPTPKELQGILERAAGFAELVSRPMFGGIMVYYDGRPFASLSNRGMAFKLSPVDCRSLVAHGGKPLQYEPDDPPSKTYTLLPDQIVTNAGELRKWMARSFGHVATLKQPKRPKPTK